MRLLTKAYVYAAACNDLFNQENHTVPSVDGGSNGSPSGVK